MTNPTGPTSEATAPCHRCSCHAQRHSGPDHECDCGHCDGYVEDLDAHPVVQALDDYADDPTIINWDAVDNLLHEHHPGMRGYATDHHGTGGVRVQVLDNDNNLLGEYHSTMWVEP